MANKVIGFIGAGNMANAMIKGLLKSELYGPDRLKASDHDMDMLKHISQHFGLETYSSNKDLVRASQTIVIAVKPQSVRKVLEEVKNDIRDDHLLISIAAGIPLKMVQSILGPAIPLIRVMPNTPALIQRGVSALAASKLVTQDHMIIAREIFEAIGKTVAVTEEMMDGVTAISGSGPGYIFKIMECLVDAGEKLGFDRETALFLVMETILGAAHLADESELSLAQLREMVTSPGGTTAAALSFFDEKGLGDIIQGAVDAACRRSVELGKNY